MRTLIINTPSGKVSATKQSFDQTLVRGVGIGFAMGKATLQRAQQCSKVIILDKDSRKKAIAEFHSISVSALAPTLSGLTRFDVKFLKPLKRQYKSERLNRNGIGIRDRKTILVP